MANRYSLEIKWSDEDECFLGRCLELAPITNMGGAIAHGDTWEDTARETQIAADLIVSSLTSEGFLLPAPFTATEMLPRAEVAAALIALRAEMHDILSKPLWWPNPADQFHRETGAAIDATMTALGLGAKEGE